MTERGWRPILQPTLLIGVLGLLLQRVSVSYPSFLGRSTEPASLVHLQAGLLLAVAMLFRDLRVLAGVYAVLFLGWIADWMLFMQGRWHEVPIGACAYLLLFAWTWACARLMGWPRARLRLKDLPRSVGAGWLLYPVGVALIGGLASFWLFPAADRVPVMVEVFFAKLFGVLVVTLPLVVGWTERATPMPSGRRLGSLVWLGVLFAAAAGSYLAEAHVRRHLGGPAGQALPLMDFRFILFVLIGAAVIRLRHATSMALLSGCLLLIGYGAARAATASNTPLGFVNLLHIAVELGVLQIAALYLLIVLRDARHASRRLERETRRDPVTGLPNLKALRGQMATTARAPERRQLGYLLLDRTEDLVSAHGLDVQAEVMTQAAGRFGPQMDAYVVGTGQFVLLPTEAADADACWEQLIERLREVRIEAGGDHFRLLPYLGVAAFAHDRADDVERALRSASQLAFQARRSNEFHPLLHDPDEGRLGAWQTSSMASEALAMLRAGQLELHFQPLQRLDDAGHLAPTAPVHGEVLCRLRDASGTLVMPGAFLPQIEAVGRGGELDLAVVRALFELLAGQPACIARFARISINLTGQSLASASFARHLLALLDAAPLGGDRLVFEITETAAILQASAARALLEQLRARGCLIAIDDFGIGMQSFERLKQLPVDILKIDGSFVRNMLQADMDRAVVQACVAVARAFHAQTVAEYVEDARVLDALRGLGVDWVQGYLIGAPRPLREVLVSPWPGS